MITVFPECAVAPVAPVVFLPSAARDQLYAIGDHVCTGISNQKVNVVAGYDVIKHRETEALFGFEHPAQITLSIARKLQEKLFLMATVSDVPNVTGKKMTVGSRIDG
jgi:hypothetical protein